MKKLFNSVLFATGVACVSLLILLAFGASEDTADFWAIVVFLLVLVFGLIKPPKTPASDLLPPRPYSNSRVPVGKDPLDSLNAHAERE